MKNLMKIFISFLLSLGLLTFLGSEARADSNSILNDDATMRYESALSTLLEEAIIGDEELVEVIANAKMGLLVNPILEGQSKVSSSHGIYSDAIEVLLKEEGDSIDLSKLIEWTERQLLKKGHLEERREEVEIETKRILRFPPPRLVASKDRTCFVKENGTVTCWGTGMHTEHPREDLRVQQISLGVSHTCIMNLDGTVSCWGSSANGRSTPPADLGRVLQISSGGAYTCAIKVDGTIACWGNSADGKCTPPSDLGSVLKISAGRNHVCAIREIDETVACWGSDSVGQSTPPKDLGAVLDISAGDVHTCAIKKENKKIVCWGNSVKKLSKVPGLTTPARQISTGDNHACAIREDGSSVCWAVHWSQPFLMWMGPGTFLVTAVAYSILNYEEYKYSLVGAIASGVWMGTVGGVAMSGVTIGTVAAAEGLRRYRPYNQPADLGSVQEISAGFDHVCAVKEDQTIVCWGDNSYGQSTPPEGRIP